VLQVPRRPGGRLRQRGQLQRSHQGRLHPHLQPVSTFWQPNHGTLDLMTVRCCLSPWQPDSLYTVYACSLATSTQHLTSTHTKWHSTALNLNLSPHLAESDTRPHAPGFYGSLDDPFGNEVGAGVLDRCMSAVQVGFRSLGFRVKRTRRAGIDCQMMPHPQFRTSSLELNGITIHICRTSSLELNGTTRRGEQCL
jgi:hypothetical protein